MKILRLLAIAGALVAAAAPASSAEADPLCESVVVQSDITGPFPFGSCWPNPAGGVLCAAPGVGPTGPYHLYVVVGVCAPNPIGVTV